MDHPLLPKTEMVQVVMPNWDMDGPFDSSSWPYSEIFQEEHSGDHLKVDQRRYINYMELSSALEKMFTTFTLGKDKLCETKLKDLLNGKDYVLTYEHNYGDWMLLGDVPREMFIDVCKKQKIMKGCDAIGLAAAPRSMGKSKMRAYNLERNNNRTVSQI
ncbi:unnamed protein product [Brassica oleracea var. botrytis]|uniref:Auxin-responsive protein n=1 Tax=Brassica napus TaxID=3708 RepID=A0A816J1P0_BRANA|nr:unnamed protein product [Brassica napus]